MLKAGKYRKRKHFLSATLEEQRRYLALNVPMYITDNGALEKHKLKEETL